MESSESPVGVSEGNCRFLSLIFARGFSRFGSVLVWTSSCDGGIADGLVEGPVPSMVVSVVVGTEVAPVRGSFAFLVLFFFFLVVAVSRGGG